jgi:hypothetical protein
MSQFFLKLTLMVRLQTVKKPPSKNPTGSEGSIALPKYFLKLHQTAPTVVVEEKVYVYVGV